MEKHFCDRCGEELSAWNNFKWKDETFDLCEKCKLEATEKIGLLAIKEKLIRAKFLKWLEFKDKNKVGE